MMRWIVGSSLKFRRLILAVAAGVLVLGVTRLGDTPVDILPEFTPTTVEVQTEALGLSAAEVEQLITVPLEQDLLNGVAFLDEIHSASLPGLSSVVMIFEPGTELLDARQVVQERLTQAHALPNVSRPPQMIQPLSSTGRVSMTRLSSKELSPIEMSVLARWVIGPRLLGVDGVANVSIWGQRERQLHVQVDPERLRDSKVSLSQIIRTTGNALEVSPLSFLEASTPGTGGFIDTPNQRLQIFHEQAISTPEQLAQVPLEGIRGELDEDGKTLTLGDVTQVVEDHQPLIGDALCRDGQCLLLVIEKFQGANTLQVTRGIDAALDAMRPGLSGMEIDSSIYRPATYIQSAFHNLRLAFLIGAILLFLAFFAYFLLEFRSALIVTLVITVSLATAVLVLRLSGVTVNTMVLAGLAMSLGFVIGDAVMDVESIRRQIRRHRGGDGGAPAWRNILDAALEMRTAGLYAGLIIVAAVVPILFMGGEAGAFLRPLALTHLVAIAASMGVALILTPALGMMLLSPAREPRESPVVRWLHRSYDGISSRLVSRPAPALVALATLVGAGLVAVPFLRHSMRPALQEPNVLIHWAAAPGTSLPRMNEVTSRAVEQLASTPGVRNVGAHVGRAVMSDQVVGINTGEIWVSVDPSADHAATVDAIQDVVDGYPQLTNEVLSYSEERVNDVLQGTDEDVVVRIYGQDDEVLLTKAEEVRDLLAAIDGVERPVVEAGSEEPALEVEVDLARAQAAGVKPGDVRRAAAILLSGVAVGNLFEDQKVFDVVVLGEPEIRQDVDDVQRLLIDAPGGRHVRLRDVADVRVAPNKSVIRHESVSKYLDVSATVEGRDVGAVTSDLERRLDQVRFPLEYHAEILGEHAEQQGARARVLAVAVAAAIGILLLLQAAVGSWRLAFLSFFALPMALAGGVLAALVTGGGTLTLGSIAGLLAVLGIAVRGVVGLVRHYQHLERIEGRPFGRGLVLSGTRDRLGSMVVTLVGTALLLVPLVFAGAGPGLEIVRPMAIVILGGLLTTTLLHLFVTPALYLRYGRITRSDPIREDLMVTIPEIDGVRGS